MKEIEICPVCGSKNITFDKSNKFLEAFSMRTKYVCNRCGNTFPLPVEVDEETYKEVKEAELTEAVLHDTPNKMIVGAGYGYAITFIVFSLITIIVALLAELLS